MAPQRYASLFLIACTIGCSGGGSAALAPVVGPEAARVPHALSTGEVIPALFRIHMNKMTGDIEANPVDRGGTDLFQGSIYSLDLAPFQNAKTFNVTDTITLDDRMRIFFSHSHPLPTPRPEDPATASNRADLGYTGRLVILADLLTETAPAYFDDIRVNTEAVPDADGYVNPGNLLSNSPESANTFPYVLLADEALDNRIGISNGGNARGNYQLGAGGWQRSNLKEGWTGFDYIHAGQTVTNDFHITINTMQSMSFELLVGVLIKYTEPKGIADKRWRMPPVPFDNRYFAYREPHGALDCSLVTPDAASYFFESGSETRELAVQVRDWDARAIEQHPQLTLTSPLDRVAPGAGGPPLVEGQIAGHPRIYRARIEEGDSGQAGDELHYQLPIIRTGVPMGHYPMLIRVTDPEIPNAGSTGIYQAGLDPDTLTPEAALALRPVTSRSSP